jgi:glycosyltransferase involved in cell wall biosynthesis
MLSRFNVQRATAAPSKGGLAWLTNWVPTYRVPELELLRARYSDLHVFVSRPATSVNLPGEASDHHLNVETIGTVSLSRSRAHPLGFTDYEPMLIPIGLLPKLFRMRPHTVFSAELGPRTLQAVLYRMCAPSSRLIIHADLCEQSELRRSSVRERIRRWMLRHADAVVVNGASGERYVQQLGVEPRKIARIPYSCDPQLFSAAGACEAAPSEPSVRRLLYAGQFTDRKGIVQFLELLGQYCVRHPSKRVELIAIGAGPREMELKALETPANLSIEVRSPVPRNDLPALYRGADLFVFPSFADTWGLVVSEAMACGLPVLGSRSSQAVEEMVRFGVNGWTFDPTSREATYQAIQSALNTDLERLRHMGRAARKTARLTSPEAVAERLARVIDSVHDPAGLEPRSGGRRARPC